MKNIKARRNGIVQCEEKQQRAMEQEPTLMNSAKISLRWKIRYIANFPYVAKFRYIVNFRYASEISLNRENFDA